MAEVRTKSWERLFERALVLIDSVAAHAPQLDDWSFGGGTALMRRHNHRFSKDIDIFIGDPQYLGYLTPRLNATAESLTTNYIEQHGFLKLSFADGEIDFVVSGPLTRQPVVIEKLLGRDVRVETSTEIVAKNVWYRGEQFTARDLFDLAMVAEKEPEALSEIEPILADRRDMILARIEKYEAQYREAFAALEVIDYRRSFEECLEIARKALGS
jgi:predicted nucleotidyltransferase component of viral defense system